MNRKAGVMAKKKIKFLAPEPPPPDGGHDPDALPEGWPEFGTLYGQKVPLRGLRARLSPEDASMVFVKIGDHDTRPFRDDGEDLPQAFVGPDGILRIL